VGPAQPPLPTHPTQQRAFAPRGEEEVGGRRRIKSDAAALRKTSSPDPIIESMPGRLQLCRAQQGGRDCRGPVCTPNIAGSQSATHSAQKRRVVGTKARGSPTTALTTPRFYNTVAARACSAHPCKRRSGTSRPSGGGGWWGWSPVQVFSFFPTLREGGAGRPLPQGSPWCGGLERAFCPSVRVVRTL
jgi:hypothetical protein